MHLEGGKAPDGTQVLGATSTSAMQERQVAVPDRWTLGDGWGLGWILFDWDGRKVIGHDGNTPRAGPAHAGSCPSSNLVVRAARERRRHRRRPVPRRHERRVFGDVGVNVPTPPVAPSTPPDLDYDQYLGRYERLGVTFDLQRVTDDASALELVDEVHGQLRELTPEPRMVLPVTLVNRGLFLVRLPGTDEPVPVVFFEFDGDRPSYMHLGARAHRRTSG